MWNLVQIYCAILYESASCDTVICTFNLKLNQFEMLLNLANIELIL